MKLLNTIKDAIADFRSQMSEAMAEKISRTQTEEAEEVTSDDTLSAEESSSDEEASSDDDDSDSDDDADADGDDDSDDDAEDEDFDVEDDSSDEEESGSDDSDDESDGDSEEDDLSDQIQDLRSELKSQLPEPEEFLSFEEASYSRDDDSSGEEDDQSPGKFPNSPRFLLRFGAIALAIAAVVTIVVVLFLQVEVPSVAGETAVDASETLRAAGLQFEIFEEEVDGIPAGEVLSTNPAAGEVTFRGTTVILRVAAESRYATVPNVNGMDFEEAQMELTARRLNINAIQTFDDTVPAGSILGFLPVTGTQVPAGSAVTVLISAGVLEANLEVPRVIGLTESAAHNVLTNAGFNPVFYHASTTRGEPDHAVAQTPGEGNRVNPGSPVLVMISMGNSTTDHPVPNLSGTTEAQAIAAIEAAGFEPEAFSMIDPNTDEGTVLSQIPPAQDTLLRSGERLGFIVSRGSAAQIEIPNVLSMNEAEALTTIREAGFNPVLVSGLHGSGRNVDGSIITQQFPRGGSQYYIGLPVLIYVAFPD